jgi:hypothetical protein
MTALHLGELLGLYRVVGPRYRSTLNQSADWMMALRERLLMRRCHVKMWSEWKWLVLKGNAGC